jgi:hypothetical protein
MLEEFDDPEPSDFDDAIHSLSPEDVPATLHFLRLLAERGKIPAEIARYVEGRLRRRWPAAARAFDEQENVAFDPVPWELLERLDFPELLALRSMVASLERHGEISELQARWARWRIEAWYSILEFDHDEVECPL